MEHLPGTWVAKIEGDAPLPAVEGLEEERVLALLEGRHVPADVAGRARILELHDLGPEVGELEGAPWPGAELLDGEDPDVGERQARARLSVANIDRHVPDAKGSRVAFHAFS